MTVRVYRNTDAGAPVLNASAAGAFINLLDKCLVTGYGAKAGAGWTKPYTGTNLAAFRMGAGSMCYLRVADTVVGNNARGLVRGYATMSDVNTGTEPFPTVDQNANGMYWFYQYNGATGTATARNWCLVADERFFYFFVSTNPNTEVAQPLAYSDCYFFGDAEPYNPTDAWFTVIGGPYLSSDNTSTGSPALWNAISITSFGAAANARLYSRRRFDGDVSQFPQNNHALLPDMGKMATGSSSDFGNGYAAYPAIDGSLLCSRTEVIDRSYGTSIRGRLPGLWCPLHPPASVPLARWDTFTGSGDLAGRTFVVWRQNLVAAYIETSDTWRT